VHRFGEDELTAELAEELAMLNANWKGVVELFQARD
jgi:hypothetical protein